MNKNVVIQLKDFAEEVAKRFSNSNRQQNFNNEMFEVEEIIPMSEHTASVIFSKDSGKKAVAFFYYMVSKKQWRYFFPTDGHIIGMHLFSYYKLNVEKDNYKHNF